MSKIIMKNVTIHIPENLREKMVQFYQEVMGMRVVSDTCFEEGKDRPVEGLKNPEEGRLVILKQEGHEGGMLGINSFPDPEKTIQRFEKVDNLPYPLIFVFALKDIVDIYEKADKFGCNMLKPPNDWEIPNVGTAKGALFQDPMGILMDLTQLPEGFPTNPPGPVSAVRRITIPVMNGQMEENKEFYESVMNMTTFYDEEIAKDEEHAGLGVGAYRVHLVSLKSGEAPEGMVGLMEYKQPIMALNPYQRTEKGTFPVCFDYATDDPKAVFEKATERGMEPVFHPAEGLTAEGKTAIVASFIDLNGILIRLTGTE